MNSAAAAIREWRHDPVKFVRDVFGVEPDAWQVDVLTAFVKHPRLAMKACKGPGKTAVLAWLCWNFLVCYLHPKIVATSITGDNLADGLWTEMAKWQNKSPMLQKAFSWTKTRIASIEHPETWWMSARTWPRGGSADQQADTLAGVHADNVMFVLDEAGGIPDAVMAAAEAGLANADQVKLIARLVQAGNPTHLAGPLYRACTTERDLWYVVEITSDPDDPKRTPRVSVQWAQEQIRKYGRDNPWVLVNVFGQFPPSSINSLLGPDDVSAAMARVLRPEDIAGAARILGVDVARFGLDGSAIAPRQGRQLFPILRNRNLDSIQGAAWVQAKWSKFDAKERDDGLVMQADGCFVDNTGGYGAGWIDQLGVLGRSPIGVAFSGKADDPRYFNKRSEMHFRAAEWVKSGGALPNDPELAAELLAHTYSYRGDRLWVCEKDLVREVLGRSPDAADAFALTFAYDVTPAPIHVSAGLSLGAAVMDSYVPERERGAVYNPL